jgi:hypothetical protein
MAEDFRETVPEEEGEIWVGGEQLASGYLNSPDLASGHFVRAGDGYGGRPLYRTGDLGFFTASGILKITGRRGLQVRVRGFRVSLVEIERALEDNDGVSRALVVPFGEPEMQLHALVTTTAATITRAALRDFLVARLPSHMIPHRLSIVDRLPLLPNHKLDRIMAEAVARDLRAEEAASRADGFATATERMLADLWKELLGVDGVAGTDDFFVIGGDSLGAMRMVARAEEVGLNIPVDAVLDGYSLSELAAIADGQSCQPLRADRHAQPNDADP